jgi:AraC-like DNA-binding protein
MLVDVESFCSHLTICQSQVRAGMELTPDTKGWSFLRVCAGSGYLVQGNGRSEVESGDLVVIPAAAKVTLRASQLGDLRLCHFGIRPEQLTGFFTSEEQRALGAVPLNGLPPARVIKGDTAVAGLHADLCDLRRQAPGVLVRSAMLNLAVRSLRDLLTGAGGHVPNPKGPEQKFAELVAGVPESELLRHSAQQLARRCGCTARHFRRLFAGRYGVALKQKQIEWRIEQAKKLLLETEPKIIEIANRCDFRSLGQFNLYFKRLTQMTPSAWRKAFAVTQGKFQRQHPPLCPRQKNAGKRKISATVSAG